MKINKEALVGVAMALTLVLAASPALAAEKKGYGGDDDCRKGTKIVQNGHIVCKDKDEKGEKGDKDKGGKDDKGKKDDDKKVTPPTPVVNSVINQIVAMISKLIGKKG